MARLTEHAVRVGPTGGEKGKERQPVASLVEIEIGNEARGPITRRLDEHATVRIADERRAVKRDRALGTDAVGNDHERTVGAAVGPVHLLPDRTGGETGVIRGRTD